MVLAKRSASSSAHCSGGVWVLTHSGKLVALHLPVLYTQTNTDAILELSGGFQFLRRLVSTVTPGCGGGGCVCVRARACVSIRKEAGTDCDTELSQVMLFIRYSVDHFVRRNLSTVYVERALQMGREAHLCMHVVCMCVCLPVRV